MQLTDKDYDEILKYFDWSQYNNNCGETTKICRGSNTKVTVDYTRTNNSQRLLYVVYSDINENEFANVISISEPIESIYCNDIIKQVINQLCKTSLIHLYEIYVLPYQPQYDWNDIDRIEKFSKIFDNKIIPILHPDGKIRVNEIYKINDIYNQFKLDI